MINLAYLAALALFCLFLRSYARLYIFWRQNRYLAENIATQYPNIRSDMDDKEIAKAMLRDDINRIRAQHQKRVDSMPKWERDIYEAEIDKRRRNAYSPETDYYEEQRRRDQINHILGN